MGTNSIVDVSLIFSSRSLNNAITGKKTISAIVFVHNNKHNLFRGGTNLSCFKVTTFFILNHRVSCHFGPWGLFSLNHINLMILRNISVVVLAFEHRFSKISGNYSCLYNLYVM
ncbi:hypothetical protein HanIR_Chr16g0816121 [Helianthus annuus]|nr:hypothetical protein HanIR_Chr16g0816121 [Helianthus annuus]